MSYSQQAYEAIKHKIVTLALPPGCVIDEAVLRDELGLGRTPIREALKLLERDRLINIAPRRGTFVTDIDLSDLMPLYESRAILEAFIARAAAQRGDEHHWREMQAVLDEVNEVEGADSTESLLDADRLCHEIMYKAADHIYLTDTLIMLYAQSQRLWHKYLPNNHDLHTAIGKHQVILDALQAGNGGRAAELVTEHIRDFQTAIQGSIVQTITQ